MTIRYIRDASLYKIFKYRYYESSNNGRAYFIEISSIYCPALIYIQGGHKTSTLLPSFPFYRSREISNTVIRRYVLEILWMATHWHTRLRLQLQKLEIFEFVNAYFFPLQNLQSMRKTLNTVETESICPKTNVLRKFSIERRNTDKLDCDCNDPTAV